MPGTCSVCDAPYGGRVVNLPTKGPSEARSSSTIKGRVCGSCGNVYVNWGSEAGHGPAAIRRLDELERRYDFDAIDTLEARVDALEAVDHPAPAPATARTDGGVVRTLADPVVMAMAFLTVLTIFAIVVGGWYLI